MSETEDAPKPATMKAIAFLKAWPTYPVLTAIHIDPESHQTARIESSAFPAPTDWPAVMRWIEARQGKANLYFQVNPRVSGADGKVKAKLTEIDSLVAFHVDVDVNVGEDQAEGIARIIKSFEAYKTPPSFINASGGGAQAFWVLSEPLKIAGTTQEEREASARDAALYNIQIERDLDGDHCHNLDRIMRLPGTINIPNAVKLKKGRKPGLASTVKTEPTLLYTLDQFVKASPDKPDKPNDGTPKAKGSAPKGGESPDPKKRGPKPSESFVYENVPIVNDDTPILTIDDPRLSMVNPVVKFLIQHCEAPADAPDNVKMMTRGGWDMKVVGELVRIGLTDNAIKQVYKLGRISHDSDGWPRGFELAMDKVITAARDAVKDDDVNALNQTFCVIFIEGKAFVMKWRDSELYPGQRDFVLYSLESFKIMFRNEMRDVTVKYKDEDGNVLTKTKRRNRAEYWLGHPQCRQYNDGWAFMPYTDATNVRSRLNLWTGWAVLANPGSWAKFQAHIRDNLCQGNEENYQYLLKWMAWIVQNRRRSGIAVLLRSTKEGTGKGFFAKFYGRIFGPHYMQVTNPEHVGGKFNPHLQNLLLLDADEAMFAGDPRHRNAVWSLITEDTLTIEAKGLTAYKAKNFLNLIITTNAEHAVDVNESARRIFALEVGDAHANDHAYFDAIEKEMNTGGYEAMLYDLTMMDLKGFVVTNCPKTEALKKQKALSRKGVDAIVEAACSTGEVPAAHYRLDGYSITGGPEGFDQFINHHPDYDVRVKLRPLGVKRTLKESWGCVIGDKAMRRDGRDVIRGIQWPSLKDLRAKFEAEHGVQQWVNPDAAVWATAQPETVTAGKPKDKGQGTLNVGDAPF
jgi:hypothetical protein